MEMPAIDTAVENGEMPAIDTTAVENREMATMAEIDETLDVLFVLFRLRVCVVSVLFRVQW